MRYPQRKDFAPLNPSAVYQQLDATTATLVAGAAVATVVTFDISPIRTLTATIAVTMAALTGLEVWVRGDTNAAWFQLPLDQLIAYGRSDAGTDITTTPAGAACFVVLDCTGWAEMQLRAKSAGAAKLSVTVGGK